MDRDLSVLTAKISELHQRELDLARIIADVTQSLEKRREDLASLFKSLKENKKERAALSVQMKPIEKAIEKALDLSISLQKNSLSDS